MNLLEALERLNQPILESAQPLRVFLACGFTPLHLETFLAAHLRDLCPTRRIELKSGLFGDLFGNLERLRPEEHDALAVVIEWSDLDSRLGVRTLGGWGVEKLADIVEAVKHSLERLESALRVIPPALPTYVCLPTLPLPPLFYTGTRQSSVFELRLRRNLASFAEAISLNRRLSVVSSQLLDANSPPARRFDLRAEITQGFPYKTSHASELGRIFAELICPPAAKKGLITDLDDTLWAGILGEVGVEGIRWNLEDHAQLHGLYQQFLASLASAGILIGAASKNEPALVDQAFQRDDLLLSKTNIFPIEAHWQPKSESVGRILKKWNILEESVVFVDDSRMEVAEVQRVFPKMECIVFPKGDYSAFLELLTHLRSSFGKAAISKEDSLRLESIRDSSPSRAAGGDGGSSLDDFLQDAKGRVTFDLSKSVEDERAFELVNKTNQFNLNGKRYDAATWSRLLEEPQRHLVTVSYEDKFGKLGRISVLMGRLVEGKFFLESWVMSCRAFSRRIEFHCLSYIFEKFATTEIIFELEATNRNGPLLEFLKQVVDVPVEGRPHLSKSSFLEKTLKMPHDKEEISVK